MKKSVLVIDDEKDLCEVISRALRKEGFEVDCAFNLAEAGEKLQAHPSIVFLDNNLPDGTGLEYIQMHSVDFMESVVIMISADPNAVLQRDAAYEGIRAFLPKPFSVSRMKQVITSLAG
jgi:DNA-binding NtrC family response regulator